MAKSAMDQVNVHGDAGSSLSVSNLRIRIRISIKSEN